MYSISDIPDWAYVEAIGTDPDFSKSLNNDALAKMFNSSPMAHVGKAKTPYMILVGEKDLRVAPHHRPFIRTLKFNKVPCK